MKDIKRGLWLIAVGISMLCAATFVRADESGDVHGCYITYLSSSGKFLFEPFLKVADKESLAEDGSSEIWGFRPWNLDPPHSDGKTYPVNIPDDRFIPLGTFKEVSAGRMKKSLKCPAGLWPTQ